MNQLRYGLIGAGMMGQEHIRNISLLDDVHLTCLADPDDSMRHKSLELTKYKATAYADYRQLLTEQDCDAYLIASPNDCHYDLLLELLPLGKPILCEKPLALTTEQCQRIIEANKQHHTPVWVAMEYRYMPPLQRLLAELNKGSAGTPQMMSITEHRYPFLSKVNDWNRFNHRTGGTMVEKCCHFWDLMRLTLNSDPVRLFASAAMNLNHRDESYQGKTPNILDNGFVVVDFANGARAMLDLCMFAEGARWQETISVVGTAGRVQTMIPGPARFSADGHERDARIAIARRQDPQEIFEDIPVDATILQAGDHHGSTFFQHQKFAQMVRQGGQPEVSLTDGLWSVRMGEAAEQSAHTHQPVEFN